MNPSILAWMFGEHIFLLKKFDVLVNIEALNVAWKKQIYLVGKYIWPVWEDLDIQVTNTQSIW